MSAVFGREVPEALARTLEIAERCNLHLEAKEHVFPHFEVPAGESPTVTLKKSRAKALPIAASGWTACKRGPPEVSACRAYEERLEREIELIKQMRFAGYFLIVWDFIRFAREQCIPVGPGRGSAAGSLVAYSLHITDVDPLQNELLFERFLNPERVSFPDIDIDFCKRRRGEVIDYVRQKYGART